MATPSTSVVYLHQGVDQLHLTEAPDREASVSHSDKDVPGGQYSLMGNEASWGPNRQHVPIKYDVTDDIVINKKATPKFLTQTKATFKAQNLSLVKGHHAEMTSIRKHKENGWIHTFKTFQPKGLNQMTKSNLESTYAQIHGFHTQIPRRMDSAVIFPCLLYHSI